MKYVELLSPAKNLECGIAAIDHGADAVYIGAARFGARSAAGNSTEDIAKLCDYAHRFGAKVYVAINTLLYENEREEARLLAWEIYRAGADALIVQDMYFRSLPIGENGEGRPPIPLHASTQMDNRTAEQVSELNELGFKQIVLARELSLEQIRSIHEAVPEVKLEVFVHGALCVSYSGRCYASEYCFNRSANRGECAQFCRLPFSLQDAEGHTLIKDKYLLSLKDMNRQQHLEALMDAGVRSFKIEGRLKDIAYVKNVTASYRQAIDAILKRRPEYVRSSFGDSTYTFTPDLSRSFSRGNTDYFLFGRTNDLASPDTPKSRGREVGHVKEVRHDCIIVSSTEVFSNGDGLCFLDENGHLQGFRVNRAEGNHLYINSNFINSNFKSSNLNNSNFNNSNFKSSNLNNSNFKIRKGDKLWRSFDQQWERLMSGQTAERRIPATFLLEETGQGFRLTFSAEDGAQCSMDFPAEHQQARTDQTASIREVLSKLGDTPYKCTDVSVCFSQPWFIPRSTLAEWRRNTIEHLIIDHLDISGENSSQSPIDLPQLQSRFGATASKSGESSPLMTCRFCLRHAWGQCKKETANSSWKDPLFLVLGDGRRFHLDFDCKKCVMKVLKSIFVYIFLSSFLLASCYYQGEDATLYTVGDNFVLAADSLVLQSNRPLHNLPVDTACEQLGVYFNDPLVVAETLVIPEDSVDSIWVKLARDQFTMGWTHQCEFLENVVPDDPISRFIHLFSIRHLKIFAIFFFFSLAVLLWQVFSRKRLHVFLIRDILSPYPTFLLITLAASALLYAGIQHYVPETWILYYYHPTLNPFGLPLILSLFLCSVWMLLVLAIATIGEVRRELPTGETILYLISLLGYCILCYLVFTLAALSPGASYILFALFVLFLLLHYSRNSRARYICGSCGRRLKQLGKCPYCGTENR